jgi:6-phosphofructokinase
LDQNLVPIKPEIVKKVLETTSNLIKQKVLETRLGLDTRVTTLGHVQRGGMTCAFDRYLATVQGVAAVDAVLNCTVDSIAPMIGMCHNEIITVPLMVAVERVRLQR